MQSLQVSTWQVTPWEVHHSKWTWPWKEQCNRIKPMQDFQCICLLIPHLHFEISHNLSGDVLMSGQNGLKSLEAKEHSFHPCLEDHLMYVHYLHSLLMSIEWGVRSSVSARDNFWRSWKCGAGNKTANIFLSVSIICFSNPNMNNSMFSKPLYRWVVEFRNCVINLCPSV